MVIDDCRQVLGLGCCGDKGAGVRAQLKDRSVRKEAGVGHKDYLGVWATVTCIVGNGQWAAAFDHEIQNDHVKVRILQTLNSRGLIARHHNVRTLSLQVPLPEHP